MKLKPSIAVLIGLTVITVASVSGRFSGTGASAPFEVQERVEIEDELTASMDIFRDVLDALAANRANDDIEDAAVKGAIRGMLRTLDPHSRFFSQAEFRQLREQQRGTYSGLGITVSSRFGRVVVVSPPFPGAPAEKVGLRVGDVISHVGGRSIEGVVLDDVVSQLKGPKGTPVEITIVRPGVDSPLDLTIVRDEISSFTVSNAFRLRDDVVYIKIETFAETTPGELGDALDSLDPSTISGLILDLRDNPGGLMQEAIEISDIFLDEGQTILETRGRSRDSGHSYTAERPNTRHQYPLVVVVNRQSASASEIVAGAIQDHDRGLIVGETSFGKGLVQSVFTLEDGFGLALTTQKWYTPSGRLIQRDYTQISDFDYYNSTDLIVEHSQDDIHYSDLGRIVYGGGGITPDVVAGPEPLTRVQELLSRSFAFYTFAQNYAIDRLEADGTSEVTDAVFDEFREHVSDRGIEITSAELDANRDFVAGRIRHEVIYNRLGVSQAARVRLEGDEQILKALETIPAAGDLALRARTARTGLDPR